MEQQDEGASANADRAVVNGAASVSALRASVPSALYEALGNLVSECADQRDVYPDDATALAAITDTVNGIYACMTDGVFGPVVAATPYSFLWAEGELPDRAVELVRSMAAVKCKNKYPVGVIGAEARAHYNEARNLAQAIEARQGGNGEAGAVHESAVPEGNAP